MEKVTIGQPLSEAETAILGLMDNGRFRHNALDLNPRYDKAGNLQDLIHVYGDSAAPSLDTAILGIGQPLLKEMGGIFIIYPEIVKNALAFVIEHEAAHVEGDYSAAPRIKSRYADPYSPECYAECEYKANLQAMTNRLKAPGMNFEKMEEEVAASLWLISGRIYRKIGVNAWVFSSYSSYIEENFPKLGEEFKEQILEKIFEIDTEYRRRYKEKLDREAAEMIKGEL